MSRRASQYVRHVDLWQRGELEALQETLATMLPLMRPVIDQTRGRVFGGDTHVADKVLSMFEPHTEAIRKGKIAKLTEFGKLVTVQEAEHQIVTADAVHDRRPADVTLWTPALDVHEATFGRMPDLAAADRGFTSAGVSDYRVVSGRSNIPYLYSILGSGINGACRIAPIVPRRPTTRFATNWRARGGTMRACEASWRASNASATGCAARTSD
jgi:hypothetical protein